MKRPLVMLAVPLIVLGAALMGFAYLRSTIPDVPLRAGEDHSAAEHGLIQLVGLFLVVFVPFAVGCLLCSTCMLARRASYSRAARWALVPVILLLLGLVVVLGSLLGDFA